MNGIFAQRRARLLSMKAVREAGPQASACPGCGAQSDRTVLSRSAVTIFPWMHTAA